MHDVKLIFDNVPATRKKVTAKIQNTHYMHTKIHKKVYYANSLAGSLPGKTCFWIIFKSAQNIPDNIISCFWHISEAVTSYHLIVIPSTKYFSVYDILIDI